MNQERTRRFSVNGFMITEDHLLAAHQVMLGIWHKNDVERALIAAGVPASKRNTNKTWINGYPVAMRAADRILQYERKAGRIAPIPNKRGYWGWVDTN